VWAFLFSKETQMSTETGQAGQTGQAEQTDEWEKIGVFRLNCSNDKPQIFYGPIDVGAEIERRGVTLDAEMARKIANLPGRAPRVEQTAVKRGLTRKGLSSATVHAMLRDIGSNMQLQIQMQ
jgi:hypothetical protein